MHYFSKYFFFLFPAVILGTFFTNGETPFCNTSIFHIVKGSFCTFVTERSAYMENVHLKRKLSDFNKYYFQLCFLYISVLRNLWQLSAHSCGRAFESEERRPKSGSLGLELSYTSCFQSIWVTTAWQEIISNLNWCDVSKMAALVGKIVPWSWFPLLSGNMTYYKENAKFGSRSTLNLVSHEWMFGV